MQVQPLISLIQIPLNRLMSLEELKGTDQRIPVEILSTFDALIPCEESIIAQDVIPNLRDAYRQTSMTRRESFALRVSMVAHKEGKTWLVQGTALDGSKREMSVLVTAKPPVTKDLFSWN